MMKFWALPPCGTELYVPLQDPILDAKAMIDARHNWNVSFDCHCDFNRSRHKQASHSTKLMRVYKHAEMISCIMEKYN